jgi:hypothetical protein
MESLEDDLSQTYADALKAGSVKLYLSRQWSKHPQKDVEKLLKQTAVQGLVFSTFRNDNPKVLMRNDWTH